MERPKITIATCSLAGCFGCHMSFLDMDERLIDLIDLISFDRSPFTDKKTLGNVDLGIIEGGVCNEENVEVLTDFRKKCRYLVAVGACALQGGVPAMRNFYSVGDCLNESYLDGLNIVDAQLPDDPELPPLLNKVQPLHEVVEIDFSLPGCPPSADAFYELIQAMIEQREPKLSYPMRFFD